METSPDTVSIKPTVYKPSRKRITFLTVGGPCGCDSWLKCSLLFFPFTEWEPSGLAFLRTEAKNIKALLACCQLVRPCTWNSSWKQSSRGERHRSAKQTTWPADKAAAGESHWRPKTQNAGDWRALSSSRALIKCLLPVPHSNCDPFQRTLLPAGTTIIKLVDIIYT